MNEKSRTNKKKIKRITQKMQGRLLFVFCVILFCIIGLIVRIVFITREDKYAKGALRLQTYVSSEIISKRGDILDRNGNILATSKPVYNLILDPAVILDRASYLEPTITALSTVYGFSKEDLANSITEKAASNYLVYYREMEYEYKVAWDSYIESLSKSSDKQLRESADYIKGVWFEEKYKRVYPGNELASHVVGFVDSDENGVFGIENIYNDYLVGTNGKKYGYYDGSLTISETVNNAKNGYTVVSTLDENVQHVIQKHTENFINQYGAKNVGVIVMDADNCEILGMQSNKSFDLNNPRDLTGLYSEDELSEMSNTDMVTALYKMWRNFCISDAYEPGSIFKPFTIAGALEEDCIASNSFWLCDGHEDFPGDIRIKCSNKSGHGNISLARSIMLSCNDALMQIAAISGREIFYDYQSKFHFGQKTGIDLLGESQGSIFDVKGLNATELATSSFGQGFTATMVQTAAAFCALINGGNYYTPHVVKAIKNEDGATVESFDAICNNKTISESTSDYLKEALYLTVSAGTGKEAAVNGYVIGGKTGTSQKFPREDEKYVVSFLGFIESGNKKTVIYVVIDECFDKAKGSRCATAMRLFKEIAEEALPCLGIYPEGSINYRIKLIEEEEIETPADNLVYLFENNETETDLIPEGVCPID